MFHKNDSFNTNIDKIDEYSTTLHRNLMKLYLMQSANPIERDEWKEEIICDIFGLKSLYPYDPCSDDKKLFTASEYYLNRFANVF